jgi:DNA-binding NarL/FixJ family response regulator
VSGADQESGADQVSEADQESGRSADAIRVLIVDDHAIVRAGFRVILESEPGIAVVGEAGDGEAAIAVAEALRPDVICMDVQMPGLDGLQATRRIVAAGTAGAGVLVLTTFDRDDYLFEALDAGASGFLLKNSPPESLVEAVQVIARGDALLSPEVTRRVIAAATTTAASTPADPRSTVASAALGTLTDREREVLDLVAQGLSNAEIAGTLVLGEATVKTHVSRILMKLGVRDRIQAVVFAYEHGLVG